MSWASSHTGKTLKKQRLSHSIVEAITMAYNSKGLRPPAGLRAQSIRDMASSRALFQGVSADGTCAAASCASPQTFIRIYRLDVTVPALLHAGLGIGSIPV